MYAWVRKCATDVVMEGGCVEMVDVMDMVAADVTVWVWCGMWVCVGVWV